jgi:antitoxin VapB
MKTAKLFLNGRSQAVRLPREYRFSGSEVRVRREGSSVVLSPVNESLGGMVRSAVREFSADYLADRNQPAEQQKRRAL